MDEQTAHDVPVVVQVAEAGTAGFVAYTQERVRDALKHSRPPVLHARVRITRHPDPAVERPVTAQAVVDVNGRIVRAHAEAPTRREAVDLLHDRLRRRVEHDRARATGHWEDRRGHESAASGRPVAPVRSLEERQVIRHTSYTWSACGVDEAAFDMDMSDHDFHLFTEVGSDQDSVLYRSGPTGYRLAQVQPCAEKLDRHVLPVSVSAQPAPVLGTDEAIERMAALDVPFLFYVDGERGRGALLYHRDDGHYGLITPADLE